MQGDLIVRSQSREQLAGYCNLGTVVLDLGEVCGACSQAPAHQGYPGRTVQKLFNLSQR